MTHDNSGSGIFEKLQLHYSYIAVIFSNSLELELHYSYVASKNRVLNYFGICNVVIYVASVYHIPFSRSICTDAELSFRCLRFGCSNFTRCGNAPIRSSSWDCRTHDLEVPQRHPPKGTLRIYLNFTWISWNFTRILQEYYKNFTGIVLEFYWNLITYLNLNFLAVPFGRVPFRFFQRLMQIETTNLITRHGLQNIFLCSHLSGTICAKNPDPPTLAILEKNTRKSLKKQGFFSLRNP